MGRQLAQNGLTDHLFVAVVDEFNLDIAASLRPKHSDSVPRVICAEESSAQSALHDRSLDFFGSGGIKDRHGIINLLMLARGVDSADMETGCILHVGHLNTDSLKVRETRLSTLSRATRHEVELAAPNTDRSLLRIVLSLFHQAEVARGLAIPATTVLSLRKTFLAKFDREVSPV